MIVKAAIAATESDKRKKIQFDQLSERGICQELMRYEKDKEGPHFHYEIELSGFIFRTKVCIPEYILPEEFVRRMPGIRAEADNFIDRTMRLLFHILKTDN